jgi:predicted DsbA family dithiol-disulfide isomerase
LVLVEIWSDIACPWCYVGKRRFETALAAFEQRDAVEVLWRSFELDPDAPAERIGSRAARIAEKYGMTVERARSLEQHMIETAAAEGLDFRFDIARSGTTFDAHRIVHLAREHGLQDAMKERLLRGYFTDGELVGDHETLVRLAAEVGIGEDETRAALAGDRYAAQVRDDERAAGQLGIRSVPTFVIAREIGVSGAQATRELLELLRQGWEASSRQPLVAVGEG